MSERPHSADFGNVSGLSIAEQAVLSQQLHDVDPTERTTHWFHIPGTLSRFNINLEAVQVQNANGLSRELENAARTIAQYTDAQFVMFPITHPTLFVGYTLIYI